MNIKRSLFLILVSILIFGLVSGAAAAVDVPLNQGLTPESPAANGSRGGIPDATPPVLYLSPAEFSEGFDDITLLPGMGWFFQNNSDPLGVTDWFQGNDTVFPAHAGAPTAYIGANYNNTADIGTISNWMLTPEQELNNGAVLSFWTRTAEGSLWPDRLQVRLSTEGDSTDVGVGAEDVGVFTNLLLDINPLLEVGGYPEAWTQYAVTLSGLPEGATGRLAFRYYVTEGGPAGNNSNYIGIDTVEFSEPPAISLSKTVGTDPLACATTDAITVTVGTDVTYCYNVENTGAITLTLHDLVDTELGGILDNFPYMLAPGASAFLTQTVTINATTVNTATWTAFNQMSYSPDDTIAYNFEDISATGTPFSLADDEVSGALPLGFSFNYYGVDYTYAYASSNGFLTVLSGQYNGCCSGQAFPTPGDPDGVIAGWWEDLNPSLGGSLYYQTLGVAPDRYFIVQYTDIQHYGGGNPITKQYKLFEGSNMVEVHYAAAPSDGGTHSAGLENEDGTIGTQYYLGTDPLSTPLAVRYTPQGSFAEAMATDSALVTVLFPEIEISPTSLESEQAPDAVFAKIMEISNVGDPMTSLDWMVLESQPVANAPAAPAPSAGLGVQPDPGSAAENVGAAVPKTDASASSAMGRTYEPYQPTDVLYDNGPLVTHPGGGSGGADASALQTALGMTIYGFGHQLLNNNRVADDFTITDAGGWQIDTITFFAYQTGSGTTSSITGVNLQIWDGVPGDPGSNIIWGDPTTNVLINTTWSNIYRVEDIDLLNADRPVMADTVLVDTHLGPGTYWLDWQTDGSPMYSGPWAPPITILGETSTGNARQSLAGTWGDLVDVGPQGLPFVIEGSLGSCYGDIPWATVEPVTGTLPGGETVPVEVIFDSTGLPLGVYTGTLCVISSDPDEGLTTVPLTMTVVPPAFGVNVGADQALDGRPTETVTYQVTVMNASNGPVDTFDLAVSGNVWTTTPAVTEVGPLGAGESEVVEVTVEIPPDAEPTESDVAVFTATSRGDPALSDSLSLTTTVIGEYGVEITPETATETGAPGEMVTYTLSVMNTGDITNTFAITYTGNVWDVSISEMSLEIGAGETVELLVHVTIPTGAVDGDDDIVTITATGLGGATDSSVLTTTAIIAERKVFLPLVMKGYQQP
jgi:hypothetical protein